MTIDETIALKRQKEEALKKLLIAAAALEEAGILCEVAPLYGCTQNVALFMTGVELVDGKIVLKERGGN